MFEHIWQFCIIVVSMEQSCAPIKPLFLQNGKEMLIRVTTGEGKKAIIKRNTSQ